jgi:hypothetical protein
MFKAASMSAHQAQHLAVALGKSALNVQIFCRCFSLVRNFLVFDNLPLIETAEAGSPDSRDIGQTHLFRRPALNKSAPFLGIEPLHSAA